MHLVFWLVGAALADAGGSGRAASFLLVDGDPTVEPGVLARPREVWIDGVKR